MTFARWDEELGLVASVWATAEYEIPDDEWSAYLKVLALARDIEDRMRAQYATGPQIPPDLAALKGVLSDTEILALVALRSGANVPVATAAAPATAVPLAALPAPKPYTPPPCEHRTQTGGRRGDSSVRCADCGQVLIGQIGVLADARTGQNVPLTGAPAPPLKTDRHGFPDYSG